MEVALNGENLKPQDLSTFDNSIPEKHCMKVLIIGRMHMVFPIIQEHE